MTDHGDLYIQIRHAEAADSADLATVQIASYRSAYAAMLPPGYLAQFSHDEETQDWQALLANPANHRVFVAEEGAGSVVGYALARVGPLAGYPYTSELVALHVLPAFQRRRIGRLLFTAITGDLRSQGVTSLLLWTLVDNPIRQWYERLGGQFVAEQTLNIDDVHVIEIGYGWPQIDSLCKALNV